ncbi:hypothetical protein V6N13_123885 [Hibiscus sabdariffa]|uniref:MADS-box domain-containing protein n=2 Tax=Hibiscus sabdariffa TaxID=183260 RepID=A0ABR2AEW2_9ROSI
MVGLKTNGSHERTQTLTIKATDARRDSFFKRNFSIFKKISELWMLCTLENALVILSVGGKPFYIGKPGVYAEVYKFPNFRMPDCDQINCVDAEEYEDLLRYIRETEEQFQKWKAEKSLVDKFMKVTTVNHKLDQAYAEKLCNVLNDEEIQALEELIASKIVEWKRRMEEQKMDVDASTSKPNGERDALFDGSTENDSSTNVDKH